jgi:hypothetical protein
VLALKWLRLFAVALLAVDALVWWFGPRAYLLIINAKGGCYPWSPSVVEYHDHMTVCPWQTVMIKVPLEIPKPTIEPTSNADPSGIDL